MSHGTPCPIKNHLQVNSSSLTVSTGCGSELPILSFSICSRCHALPIRQDKVEVSSRWSITAALCPIGTARGAACCTPRCLKKTQRERALDLPLKSSTLYFSSKLFCSGGSRRRSFEDALCLFCVLSCEVQEGAKECF